MSARPSDDQPTLPVSRDRASGGATSDDDPLAPLLRAALQPSYLLVRRLGQGGMGSVYLARDPVLKRSVAVKVMVPELARDETSRARFQREAQAVAAIAHPNVVSIYSVGALPDGTPYFVMQFVEGRSLEDRVRAEGPLDVREARRVLGEVASALAAAHKRGIVHRDIKPANILQDAESGLVIVSDFGIAAVRDPEAAASPRLTQTGMSPGTPFYMSPEQLLGEQLSDKSDIYSFGLMAYELLTGRGPFKITSPQEAVAAHLRDVPPPLTQLRPDVDTDLEHLVASCLAKKPEDRPAAEQIAKRLLPGEGVMLEWPPPRLETLVGHLPKLNRRLGLGSGLLAAAILGIILADPDRRAAVPLWFLELASAVGFILALRAANGARRLMREARRAVRMGYTWLTVMETVSDPRGDTGGVITGVREYAPLAPATRGQVRAWRVAAAVCGFGAAVAPLPALLLLVRLGAHGTIAPPTAAALMLVPSLVLVATAWALRRIEARMVRRPHLGSRKPAAVPKEVVRKMVEAWNESLEAARAGQSLGARALHPVLTRVVVGLALLVVYVAVVAVTSLAVVATIGNVLYASASFHLGSTMKMRDAEVGRAYGVPPDPAITPEAGGRAYHALSSVGRTDWPSDMRPPDPVMAEPFLPRAAPFEQLGALGDSLIRRAIRGGFTPAERSYLERLAAHPGFALFALAARAPRADIIGGRHTIATLDSLSTWSLSLPRYAILRDAAYARSAVAALRLSQGRRDEAETLLREEVSFGLGLMDHGISPIETLFGVGMARAGLDRLETLYRATGRGDAAERLREARDSARARAEREDDRLSRAEEASAFSGQAAAARATAKRLLADSTFPPSLRWEFVHQLGFAPCANVRELIFGPSPNIAAALQTFRRQVLHTASDSALFRAVMAGPFRVTTGEGLGSALYVAAAKGLGSLLGNPRLAGCAVGIAPIP